MTTLVSRALICAFALFVSTGFSFADDLAVLSVQPPANSLNASIAAAITVQFDRPVNPATFNAASVRVFGRWSGPVQESLSFSNNDQTLTITPDAPFSAGETVMVILSHDLLAADGSPLRPGGYSWQFWIAARPACFNFQELDSFTNRTPPQFAQTRIYGALGSDLDNDGWLDIVTVNEVSADLRVFMNTADGSGLFGPVVQPIAPGLVEMSPNEPGDFNNDGNADLCVCSTATDKVLVFLGNGNGTFAPAQIITVGDSPLGIAVLDIDGDGDPDIVNGNHGSNNLSRMLNNGSGVFGAPAFFEGNVAGEYGIAAADMNADGLLDLVIGGNSSQQVSVMRGNGNATFSNHALQSSGGLVWQIGAGDVNGDGHADVHTSNSFSNSGSILLNNGSGGLNPPVVEAAGGHSPATDLGDFDGDGDLDWLLSSFGGGLWRLFVNDGSGSFSISQDFDAPANPSCGTAMDFDNDRDLDIVLLDEIADVVILMENIVVEGDVNCDTVINIDDLFGVIGAWGPCPKRQPCPTDIDGDGGTDIDDLFTVIANWD